MHIQTIYSKIFFVQKLRKKIKHNTKKVPPGKLVNNQTFQVEKNQKIPATKRLSISPFKNLASNEARHVTRWNGSPWLGLNFASLRCRADLRRNHWAAYARECLRTPGFKYKTGLRGTTVVRWSTAIYPRARFARLIARASLIKDKLVALFSRLIARPGEISYRR